MRRSEYGRLGLGPETEVAKVPTLIPGLDCCVEVACGDTVSMAITASGDAKFILLFHFHFFSFSFFEKHLRDKLLRDK
jgi:Regulator of chromosome condensation (RCC1) repeat